MESPENQRSTVILRDFLADPKNHKTFGRFAAKYQPWLKRCCERRGLQDADAEDLTAAILLRFFERDVFQDFVFQTKEKFYHWLDTVVKHGVLTFLRDRGRKPDAWSVGNADVQESLKQVTRAMLRDLESICEEDRARLRTARVRIEEHVHEKTRQAFRMLTDEGRTVDEVVQALDMTPLAVWKVRSRMLRKLRDEFDYLQGSASEEV